MELDSYGYAKVVIKGTPGAEQLWIEVEDPALSAANTAITVNGQPALTVNTALGAAAIVRPGTEDVEVTIGVHSGKRLRHGALYGALPHRDDSIPSTEHGYHGSDAGCDRNGCPGV
jgi:hypothetical protein